MTVVCSAMVMAKYCVAHCDELGKEKEENRHENDSLYPIVIGYRARQARIVEGFIRRGKKLELVSLKK